MREGLTRWSLGSTDFCSLGSNIIENSLEVRHRNPTGCIALAAENCPDGILGCLVNVVLGHGGNTPGLSVLAELAHEVGELLFVKEAVIVGIRSLEGRSHLSSLVNVVLGHGGNTP